MSLPDDVIVFNILTRLSAKSIIRFRCVSISWNSIITSPEFIKTHFDKAKSLSHNNRYLLYSPFIREKYDPKKFYFASCIELYITVFNSDRTLTEISKFELPFSHASMVSFCNGMYLCRNTNMTYEDNLLYLWNPCIRKFKKLLTPCSGYPFDKNHIVRVTQRSVLGLAYHSQNNDFKILRLVCYEGSNEYGQEHVTVTRVEAEVYTLSTDSWRSFVISVDSPNIGSIDDIDTSTPCKFVNGALHFMAYSWDRHQFIILSFDINDEKFRVRFREVIEPQKYLYSVRFLEVFKGSLALFFCDDEDASDDEDARTFHIWVMREDGAVESFNKKGVITDYVDRMVFLYNYFDTSLFSYDPESLEENNLGIPWCEWIHYTADFMENLVLIDQVKCHLYMKISLLKLLTPYMHY